MGGMVPIYNVCCKFLVQLIAHFHSLTRISITLTMSIHTSMDKLGQNSKNLIKRSFLNMTIYRANRRLQPFTLALPFKN